MRYNFAAVRSGTQLHETVLPSTSSVIPLPGPNLELIIVTYISIARTHDRIGVTKATVDIQWNPKTLCTG